MAELQLTGEERKKIKHRIVYGNEKQSRIN